MLLDSVMNAVVKAEKRKNAPVNFIDIYRVWKALNETESTAQGNDALWEVKYALIDLFKQDEILGDKEMSRFSLNAVNQSTKQQARDFDLCSDRLAIKFPTYNFDSVCKVMPGTSTNKFNFDQLKALLLSKDLSMDKHFDQDNLRFLDASVDMTGNRVAFQSFVRSGNTFLRRFIEQITGVYTGSDMHVTYTFFEAMRGLPGLAHVCDEN